MIELQHFLFVSAILFCIGLFIVITRKNLIMILIGVELMINAAVLNLVAFGRYDKIDNEGQLFALFVIVLAAAGMAVALAIVLNVYKYFKQIDPDVLNELKN